MGCLTAPFKLIGCLGVLALAALGWLYRDRIVHEVRTRLAGAESATAPEPGRPSPAARRSAVSKVDSLNGWGADSVVLTAGEVASLLEAGLDPAVRRQLDSVTVVLGQDELEVRALLSTARLPHEVVGPFGAALRDREPVAAGGTLAVVGDGRAAWTVERLTIRDFPLPRDAVPRLMARALGEPGQRAVPVRIPRGIRDIRLRPGKAVLYGARPS